MTEKLLWICKYCGENYHPRCNKCVREDGKMVEDELHGMSDDKYMEVLKSTGWKPSDPF